MAHLKEWVAAAVLAAAAAIVTVAPARADTGLVPVALEPAPRFETHEMVLRDATRKRDVPVRLYWPTAATTDQAVPLVVFSHGIGGSRSSYRYLGSHFASHGIASLHVQHVGSDHSLWGGGLLLLPYRLYSATRDEEAIERVRDLSFALDRLLASAEFGARIDAGRIVAAGHSYGANTVMLAAGARLPRGNDIVTWRDARIKAALLLSAPPFFGAAALAPVLAGVAVPSLHITATEDVIRIPGYYSPPDDRLAVFEAIGSAKKMFAMFRGGSHTVFTDRGASGQAVARVKEATQDLVLAFLRSVFDGVDGGLHEWPLRYRDIIAQVVDTQR